MERERRRRRGRRKHDPGRRGAVPGGPRRRPALPPGCGRGVAAFGPPPGRAGPGWGGVAGEKEEEERGSGGVMPRARVAARQAAARPAPRGAALRPPPLPQAGGPASRRARGIRASGSSEPRPERAEGRGKGERSPLRRLQEGEGRGESLAEGV